MVETNAQKIYESVVYVKVWVIISELVSKFPLVKTLRCTYVNTGIHHDITDTHVCHIFITHFITYSIIIVIMYMYLP